jgi:transcriptional regulator with XRE-family HTH domain
MSDEEARAAAGRRIAMARELLGLTQGALASKVYVTQPAVSQWERGLTLPALAMQHAIADALRTTRSRLFREIVQNEEKAA